MPGHLQTHEELCEAAHTAHTGPDSPALLTPRTERPPGQERCRFCPPISRLCCRTKLADTVGSGVELQAERASTALQGTPLLPAQAAVGAAWLHAPPAAPGGVVGAGETIKLQRAEPKEKMSVKRCCHKRVKLADRLSERKGRWEMDTLNRALGFLG